MAQQKLLIEEWLPIEVIGAESMRERGASSALPPNHFLHVWWARRPLTASRAAILGSVLPSWSEDWPKELHEKFPDPKSYQDWFLRACGVFGDPVVPRKFLLWARSQGKKVPNPYTHPRSFTVSPDSDILNTIGDLLEWTWGTRTLKVMDTFAGGGAIPFEAIRYQFNTTANELNPVASVILKATLDFPARFGHGLVKDIRKFGDELILDVQTRLAPFYTDLSNIPDALGSAYLWARTVVCPYTGKVIPLSPNWWLLKGKNPVAVSALFPSGADKAVYKIVQGKEACIKAAPDEGTIKSGNASSPWANHQIVKNKSLKQEAINGRMGKQLYAVVIKRKGGMEFRSPIQEDIDKEIKAGVEMKARFNEWENLGIIPTERLPMNTESWTHGNTIAQYGGTYFYDLFTERQLLSACTYLESLKAIKSKIISELGEERGKAVITYLAFALDKAVDYNAQLSTWENTRGVAKHVFKRHDFAFPWTFSEFDASRNLFSWALEQVVDAFDGIAKLSFQDESVKGKTAGHLPIAIHRGSATNLKTVVSGSIDTIVVDPPYHDNVMYAECSDFFYVWMKRSLGDLYPEFFSDELTNKDDEAVANKGRFSDFGKNKIDLSTKDYERKMAAAFLEMHRVLRDDGVLTVMFTHKKVEAWDTLATSLIGAGFAIHASWPVHTESEHSLHQAKKNSAASTILITCRKRTPRTETIWWEDLKPSIRQVARDKAAEFESLGIRGVDLYISTFGPVLQVLSERWPVLSGELDDRGNPKALRPEVALDLAREEVINLRKRGLLLGRTLSFDPPTDWYLMAWDAFQAAEFPADEARKLALSLGMDMEREIVAEKRLVAKKASTVVIQEPKARLKKGMVDSDLTAFPCVVDAVHTAMVIYQEEGATACEAFLNRTGLMQDPTFKACLQALINAVPRTRTKGKFNRMEALLLDDLRLAFFDDLVAPKEEEPKVVGVTSQLTAGTGEDWLGEDDEDTEDEGEGEE